MGLVGMPVTEELPIYIRRQSESERCKHLNTGADRVDLPSPEEITGHVHCIHTAHDKLHDSLLHVLSPSWPIVPRATVRVACIVADALEPLTALEHKSI